MKTVIKNGDIKKMNIQDMKSFLYQLKLLKKLKKDLGMRGIFLFKNMFYNDSYFSVEYHSSLDKQYVLGESKKIFSGIFKAQPKHIKLIENNNIQGGMKLFMNETMFDLSFKKITNALKT